MVALKVPPKHPVRLQASLGQRDVCLAPRLSPPARPDRDPEGDGSHQKADPEGDGSSGSRQKGDPSQESHAAVGSALVERRLNG